jgi:hypothetical protein
LVRAPVDTGARPNEHGRLRVRVPRVRRRTFWPEVAAAVGLLLCCAFAVYALAKLGM